MADITGKWDLYSSEGFDEYLKAVGVNFMLRKLIGTVTSGSMEIVKLEGDQYALRMIAPMKTHEIKFKVGEEFDDKMQDGRQCKTLFTLEGNVLKQRQRITENDGIVETTIDRAITPDEVVATLRYKDQTAIRKFKKSS